MPYTPELDYSACTTLRRLSWAIGEPMTKTMKEVFKVLPLFMDSNKVCDRCKDATKCNDCYFDRENKEELKSEMFTDLLEKENLQSEFYNSRFIERTQPKRKRQSPITGKEWTPEWSMYF